MTPPQPPPPPPPPPSNLPPDWKPVWSAEHESYYYYNKQTKETSWTIPGTTEEQGAESEEGEESEEEVVEVDLEEEDEGGEDKEPEQTKEELQVQEAKDSKKRKAESQSNDDDEADDEPDLKPPAAAQQPQPPNPFYPAPHPTTQPTTDFSTGKTTYSTSLPSTTFSALDALFDKIDESKRLLDEFAPPVRGQVDEREVERLREEVEKVDEMERGIEGQWNNGWGGQVGAEDDVPDEFKHEYTSAALFDTRTGKFRRPDTHDPRISDPRLHFSDSSRAIRQMSVFFDYESYAQQRAMEAMQPKEVKKWTRREVEEFKKKKEEKKRRRLLGEYGKESDGLLERDPMSR